MARAQNRSGKEAGTQRRSSSTSTPKPSAKAAAKVDGKAAAPRSNGRRPKKAEPVLITHEQIAAKAYEIWEKKGRPMGTQHQDWLEAEAALGSR